MNPHVYTSALQPATDFTDDSLTPPAKVVYRPGELVFTSCCEKRRRAANAAVQCYYDGRRFWCIDGKGCKDPRMAEARRHRQIKRRGAGAKRGSRRSAIAARKG